MIEIEREKYDKDKKRQWERGKERDFCLFENNGCVGYL